MRKLFKRKSCTVLLLLNAVFLSIILISTYHTTNLLNGLKSRVFQLSTTEEKWKGISATYPADVYPTLDSASALLAEKVPGENVILFWTKYFTDDPSEAYDLEVKADPECFSNCRIVADKGYLGVSDAVVFHSRDLSRETLPPIHPRHQNWVYLQQESPSNTKEDLSGYLDVFNWTMTYRRDSDVYHPYKRILPVDSEQVTLNTSCLGEVTKRKSKLVAWVVSNCHTPGGREDYVEEMQKFVSVDIYGKCGDFVCSRGGVGCIADIANEYKFYLSLENSLCSDYVTEKFFHALQYNLVPIVYGGADYDSIAPPGSFINLKDFSSPKMLAEYLIELDKDTEKYLQYFKWKSKFKVVSGGGWCSLCKKLEGQKTHPVEKTYGSIEKWWLYVNYEHCDDENSTRKGDKTMMTRIEIDLQPACQDSLVVNKTQPGIISSTVNALKVFRKWLRYELFG